MNNQQMNKEDAMWMGIWHQLQEDKMKPPNEREITIQDSDGGFFERFGSMLHARNEDTEDNFLGNAALVDPEASAFLKKKEKKEAKIESRIGDDEDGDTGKDSGNESAEADSDIEEKKEDIQEIKNAMVGMNIDELYEEILFEILHNVGSDESKVSTESLFSFLQEAFKFQQESHEELLEKARIKEAPEMRLNIEVIEAKDLNSKDPNGLADPFVTLYIASAPNTRYTSSVKSATLNPKYEEHFSLPISENPNEDTLIIEVWDFDPAETIGEKMNKFFEIKGAKGFRKLMKEIATTASSGKHDNEFVGCSKVPLKTIPAAGLVMWYNLDKKGKTKTQGTIKVRLNFSSAKNDQVASQEHRHLLKILLYHELESSKVAHHWWSGKFSSLAETIITQHQAQSGLTDIDVAFAQWSVYCEVHQHHPLSFELFERIIDKLIKPIQTRNVTHEEEITIFFESTKRLLPSCFGIIRKLRKKLAGDANTLKHLTRVINIISKIATLEPTPSIDLFPEQYFGWLKKTGDLAVDIRDVMNQAVTIAAEEYFDGIVDQNELNSDDNESRLQQLIKVIQLVRSDLQRAIEHHDKVFQEKMNYQYAAVIYKVYDRKVMELVKPIVQDICNTKIERLDLLDSKDMKHNRYEEINMLTTLFELYLLLKRFSVLGSALCPGVVDFQMKDYYEWFSSGVAHWLDISVYKALTRIQKAIELDPLIAVDATVKYSSSAVDTLAIFYQIRIFWQQLAWPSAEGAFIFVSKIVDDICRCCVFYADKMAERVDSLGMVETVYEKKFQVTTEWCLAINNIDYIRQSIHSFVKELGVDDIIRNMSDFRGPLDAKRCSDTIQNVMENAIDTEKNKILELIEKLARKMNPAMRRFLTEGAELFDTDSNAMDRLMMYMEDSLKTLHTELNDDNFTRVLDAIWVEISCILYDLVQGSIEKRRPPSFYSNLRSTLQIMVENFKCQNSDKPIQSSDKETLESIDKLLELHGYEPADLIHQYYKERYTMQQKLEDSPFGLLTVQCFFQKNVLEIEVMNAKHLIPMDTDGQCDPFVRIHFFPEDKFAGVTQPKTKVIQKTLFPMFDEKFSITLNDEQRKLEEAIILFSVKDKDYFGIANQYVADTFLMFKDIADITSDSGSIKQLHLKLTRPESDESMESVKALQYRVGDKLAKEFLKKLKTKATESK
ncbi:CLUMA_CG002131, isoform A [Clunio marinus]|uniref:CLUMA_CG002131, isoform A n=1 Tax=Clunio marinus TaxID=568069 RepID=A0A1J1HLD3_9DIPT|nr:CLUMA_CG002131, isoform A [Clunio marinus]